MILTEEQAKKTGCPFWAAVATLAASVPNFKFSNPAQGTCLASECMMWRRVETPEFKSQAEAEFKRTGRRLAPDAGYCGLAGKPDA